MGNSFRLTPMQGALLGSFFLHAVIFYGLGRLGDNAQVSSISQKAVFQVELLAPTLEIALPDLAALDSIAAPTVLEPIPLPAALEPIPAAVAAQQLTPVAVAESPRNLVKQSDSTLKVLSWKQQEPKVQKFPDLEYPPDTLNITATLEIEITLDKDGKATAVRVISESPKSMFTEWAWEMGMKGFYTPKITTDGPVASTLKIRLDITPGMSVEVH